jgi:amino acid permease
MYDNGYAMGTFLILFGGFLSAFSGYLIAYCAHKTNSSCYEEIALAIYGKKMMKITSYCMLPCNMGFLCSYFVVFKTYMPYSIE